MWRVLDPGTGDAEYVHDWTWRPKDPEDYPPGFVDVHEFWAWVEGEDASTFAHYDALYAQ